MWTEVNQSYSNVKEIKLWLFSYSKKTLKIPLRNSQKQTSIEK